MNNPEKLISRVDNFSKLFNEKINGIQISKALLTIEDYSQLASWRFLFGNDNGTTWRELFTRSNQRKRFEITRITLLQLLDELSADVDAFLQNSINTYLNNFETVKDWRFYFVKYPEMRQGNSGVYFWRNDKNNTKENPYEIFMMNTGLTLGGKHWDPFLLVLSKSHEFKKEVSLEEYGASLVINKTGEKINCKNSSWEILDSNNVVVKQIEIPQENGIDSVDRIELIKNYLTNIFTE